MGLLQGRDDPSLGDEVVQMPGTAPHTSITTPITRSSILLSFSDTESRHISSILRWLDNIYEVPTGPSGFESDRGHARVIQRSPSDYRVQETRLRYSPGGYFSHLMTTPLPLNPRKHPNRKFLGPGIYRPPPGIENSEQTFHAGFFSMQLHKHTWCHPRRWHRLLELWRTLMIR